MAGTNSAQASSAKLAVAAPVIILVQPQLGENIGMCARAMLNCAVTELRIVRPRDGWPNPSAISASSGAVYVIENARIFETTAEAIADLDFVLATTARQRDMVKPVHTAEEAGKLIHARNTTSGRAACGILFGPERTGLENDDIALANAILNIPLNPGFSSLNLAQAVLLVCYSWLSADNPFASAAKTAEEDENSLPASKGDIENFLQRLETSLDDSGFFRSEPHKPSIVRNIRNFFFRAAPSVQEVRTLQGIVSALIAQRGKK
jgi:tRNA/rRNA methyltransferase